MKIGDMVRVKTKSRPYLKEEFLGIGWVVGLPPRSDKGTHLFPWAEIYFVSGKHTSMLVDNLEIIATIYNGDAT